MPKILTYNSPSNIEKKIGRDNPIKAPWNWFSSQEKYTKFFILTALLIVVATPFLVSNLLETRQRAEGPTSSPAQIQVDKEDVVKKQTLELLSLTKQLKTDPNTDTQTKITSLVKDRKTNLSLLISENPGAVVKIALPNNIKNSLPKETQADIESADTIEGTLEVLHSDDFKNKVSKTEYFLTTKDKTKLSLYFAQGKPEAQALTGADVKVKGVRLGDKVAIASTQKNDFEVISTGKKVLGTSTVKKVAVILFNYLDDTTQPYTPDQVRGKVFTNTGSIPFNSSVNAYYKEASFGLWSLEGKTRADGDVFGWYTVPYSYVGSQSTSNVALASQAADNAAAADGFDPTGYTNIIHISNEHGTWGFAQLGGVYSYVNGPYSDIMIHELGHNFGMQHAGSLTCKDASGAQVPISDTCTGYEYGDPYDPMGGGTSHLNNYHKELLGFFDSGNSQTVTTSGTYTIDSLEPASSGVKALKIPKTIYNGVVSNYYYVEFRQTFGTFDNFSATHPAVNGVMIRIAPVSICSINCGGTAETGLINTQADGNFFDSPLPFGQTFTDAANGVSIKADSKTSTSSATVDVTFPTQCIRQKPTVSVQPIVQWGTPGQTLSYDVTVTDNDGSLCKGTKFTLFASADTSGFTFSPNPYDLNNMTPGKTVATTINVTSGTTVADGFYPLTFYADNNNLATLAIVNYNVASINPLPTPTSTSPSPSVVPITQPVTNPGNITGTVSSSLGGVVIGAKITTKVGKTNLTYTSDSFGNYVIAGLPPATYTLKFTAQGYSSQTASVTVTSNNTTTQNVTLVKR